MRRRYDRAAIPFQGDIFGEYVEKEDVVLDITWDMREQNPQGRMRNLRRRGFHYLYRARTAETVRFSDESVDAVILSGVLTCMIDADAQHGLMGEIRRILRPGGILYVHDLLMEEMQMKRLLGEFRQEDWGSLTFTAVNGSRAKGFYYIGIKETGCISQFLSMEQSCGKAGSHWDHQFRAYHQVVGIDAGIGTHHVIQSDPVLLCD
jgi:SAM-dependent methyltransferase